MNDTCRNESEDARFLRFSKMIGGPTLDYPEILKKLSLSKNVLYYVIGTLLCNCDVLKKGIILYNDVIYQDDLK